MRLSEDFLWGVSSSAHQVEGDNTLNQWSEWERAGRVRDGSTSGPACRFWDDPTRDLELMQHLGLNAARVSIEWSRLEPQEGRWDASALGRYYRLLADMRQRGIRPFVTLHHFTHPKWFEERGGFLAPDVVDVFSRYVYRTVEVLRHVCSDWVTINEPNVFCAFGYLLGEFPPGRKGDLSTTLQCLTRMARCHAAAYRIIHSFQNDAKVGWAQNYVVFEPGTSRARDRFLANIFDSLFNQTFFDLVRTGKLRSPWHRLCETASEAQDKYDFVGLNVYSRLYVTADRSAHETLFARVSVPDHVPQGDPAAEYPYGECYPGAIAKAVEVASADRKPIYILENGVPDRDDRIRPWLIVQAARSLQELTARGQDVRGYFHWCLTDNFEWSEGWRLRFGLYELDRASQQRTPRRSAEVFRRIVQANGVPEELLEFAGEGSPPVSSQIPQLHSPSINTPFIAE